MTYSSTGYRVLLYKPIPLQTPLLLRSSDVIMPLLRSVARPVWVPSFLKSSYSVSTYGCCGRPLDYFPGTSMSRLIFRMASSFGKLVLAWIKHSFELFPQIPLKVECVASRWWINRAFNYHFSFSSCFPIIYFWRFSRLSDVRGPWLDWSPTLATFSVISGARAYRLTLEITARVNICEPWCEGIVSLF